jgi:GNAT superfamily N-acetyltransferase
LTLGPWEAAPELLERLAAAREGSLDGVFLTSPQAPTREACLAAYQKALADPARPLLPWASFVAYLDGRPVGLLLCVQGNHERQGLLFDLFADPEARGQGVGRALVGAMQQALVARGYTENMFLAASDNGPVHRLFTPDQIVRQDETHGAWWCAHA